MADLILAVAIFNIIVAGLNVWCAVHNHRTAKRLLALAAGKADRA